MGWEGERVRVLSHEIKRVSLGGGTFRISSNVHLLFFRGNIAKMKRCQTMLLHLFNENLVIFVG